MSDVYWQGRVDERADTIAFLQRRQSACETIAGRSPDQAERASIMQRQLSVLIDEIRAGMHEGDVEVAKTSSTGT